MSAGGQFRNKEEEILYWKAKADSLSEELRQQKHEAEEFEANSRELEKEYDSILIQREKTIKDLNLSFNRAQNEIESLRSKLEQSTKENSSLENTITNLSKDKIDLSNRVRELEQKNDDLERSRRIIEESIQSFKVSLNSAIERNALLESEVDEQEALKEKLQRLIDETSDLKQELNVKKKETIPDNDKAINGFKPTTIDSNKLKETETQTTPIKRDTPTMPPLSSTSRIMALNLVGDLIRKVGLSRYLCAQCGNFKCSACPKKPITEDIKSLERAMEATPYDFLDQLPRTRKAT